MAPDRSEDWERTFKEEAAKLSAEEPGLLLYQNTKDRKEAGKYTYLAELHESEGGISLAERATTGRHLREQAALEEVLEKARKQSAEHKKKK